MRLLRNILLGIAFNMGALYVTVELLDKITYAGGIYFFLVAGIVIGLLNTFLKPILKFLTLPFVFLTGGLFLIVINAFILWFTVKLIEVFDVATLDFQIEGAVTFMLAAILFGLVNWFEHWMFKRLD